MSYVGLLRVFASCRAISVKSRNGSLLFIHQFYSLPELFGIVWIEVSEIIVLLGSSQLTYNSISFILTKVEEARISVFPGLSVQTISFFIAVTRFLDIHGKFLLLGRIWLGIHSSTMLKNLFCQFFKDTLMSLLIGVCQLVPSMSEQALPKSACAYFQTTLLLLPAALLILYTCPDLSDQSLPEVAQLSTCEVVLETRARSMSEALREGLMWV